ncbi:MAG: hypothetical protein IT582_01130 [Opitutaceae bacterium]|nr:hypothetical protein [Opitutaceae bacterium]
MISIFGILFGSAGAEEETRRERSIREKKDREVIRELAKAGWYDPGT